MEFKSLAPKIDIYNFSEEMDEIDRLLSQMDESKWGPWGPFGSYTRLESTMYEGIPSNLHIEATSVDPVNKAFTEKHAEIFKKSTLDYIKRHNLDDKELATMINSLCKYNPKKVKYTNLIMAFHTDFQQEKKNASGLKHFITANFYINEDYTGGDIMFLTGEDESIIRYKPKRGDMIIFPSIPPYYHGVRTLDEGQKYFVRSFWYLRDEGSEEWNLEKSKYSEEEWKKKENLRERIERNSYMKWIKVD